MLFLIGLLCFASIALLAYGLLHRPADIVRRRIVPNADEPARQVAPRRPRPVQLLLSRLGRRISRVLPQNLAHSVDVMLIQAGEPWPVHLYLGVWLTCIAGGVLFVLYIAVVGSFTALQVFVLAAIVLFLAGVLPYAYLRDRVKKRQKAIIRSLPDAMDLLVTCVEAGMAVDAAFSMVTEKTEGPLAETFAEYLRQVALGRPRRESLIYVAQRTGVEDMIEMANAIGQGEDLGTTIGDVLRLQSEDLRAVRRQRAQEAAQRAPVLMTIPLVLCFVPAMGLVVIVPSILNLINFVGEI
jgi:tight adherence protein C